MLETGSLNILDRLKESSAYHLVWFSRACKSTYDTYTMDCIDHEHYWWIDEHCVHISRGGGYIPKDATVFSFTKKKSYANYPTRVVSGHYIAHTPLPTFLPCSQNWIAEIAIVSINNGYSKNYREHCFRNPMHILIPSLTNIFSCQLLIIGYVFYPAMILNG